MWFSFWLRTWKRSNLGQRRWASKAPRQRGSFRPRLEVLEERRLLSTYYATTTSDLIADINAANKAGGANTIVLTAPTTSPYVLTAVDNTTNGANGLPVISGGGNKVAADNLTIIGNGDTIERSTASGTPAFRLFDVASGSSLTLESVTLQNGLAFGSGSAADGGAIYNQGTLTLIGATLKNNTAQGSNGAAGVVMSNLKNGKSINGQAGADAAGGGIWSSGSVMLQGGTILQANQALGGQGGAAGAWYRSVSDGGPVSGNGGTGGGGFGGGLYEAGGTVAGTNAMLTGNTARGGTGGDNTRYIQGSNIGSAGNGGFGCGGGLYVAGGNLDLNTATVSSNLAMGGTGGFDSQFYYLSGGIGGTGSGGGFDIAAGTATLASVNLLSNTAEGGTGGAGGGDFGGGPGGNAYGGGLYVGSGTVTLTNDTVSGNEAIGGAPGPGYYGYGTPIYGSSSGAEIFIASGATVNIDSFTLASVGSNGIDGTYTLLS